MNLKFKVIPIMPVVRRCVESHCSTAAVLVTLVFLTLAMCHTIQDKEELADIVHANGKSFAGSESCRNCHAALYDSHIQTAHYLTSRPASPSTVMGSFEAPDNTFSLDRGLKVVMKKTPGALLQVGFVDGWEVNAKPFDIVIGSGGKGQTYLFWENSELFQLPVSYYTPLDTWCNSPGYPVDQILFNRKISARCLECHGTYLKAGEGDAGPEKFDKTGLLYGVDCERCHGPAADHVNFHRRHPHETKAQAILNTTHMTRQQRLDNCALCHSGIRENIKPSFSFLAGDRLEDYSMPAYHADSTASLDVHGNQYGLLTASKCFKGSEMDCSSCHNVHVRESGDLALFSRRCQTCHAPEGDHACTQPVLSGLVLSRNCIDCHMPALSSSQIFLQVPDTLQSTPDLVRTHLIGIYKENIKKYLEKL